ncbi:MAG: hypothetical protein ABR956_12975 [Terracidiphilus sp.]|jgi:hypothetical protein
MEADWEFEAGGDAPVIDAHWPGFVDLRHSPERARQLPEAIQFPALAQALADLNAPQSPVWTSKCDFWPHLEADEFDADELDAPAGCAIHAMGCYIDLLPKGDRQWSLPANAAAACKSLCSRLQAVPLRSCRTDLVIRRAALAPELMDLGITAYLTCCGATESEACVALQAALAAFAGALCVH